MLTRLVEEKGAKWKDIGAAMGRAGYACRDKWRMMRNNPTSGEWSDHEVTRLKELVQEYFEAQQAGPGRGGAQASDVSRVFTSVSTAFTSSHLYSSRAACRNGSLRCSRGRARTSAAARQHQLEVHLADSGYPQRKHVHAEVVSHRAVRDICGAVGQGGG
mmetsp:Transcript_19018/g.30752  ORF Transcript_19018/g.30752 Transcript_19018/m.30752 type:complete len:160 (+) Transcript_19018:901-1380(+)